MNIVKNLYVYKYNKLCTQTGHDFLKVSLRVKKFMFFPCIMIKENTTFICKSCSKIKT